VNIGLDGSELPNTWIKSSYSNGAGGECVECARVGDIVLVRDTKSGAAPMTRVGLQAWLSFTGATGRGWPTAR
jgi:hypothetical protein